MRQEWVRAYYTGEGIVMAAKHRGKEPVMNKTPVQSTTMLVAPEQANKKNHAIRKHNEHGQTKF